MKNTKLKKLGLYLLILQLTACQTPVPKLKPDAHLDNRLQNPAQAVQVPEKIANINERDQKIYALLADENEAWQHSDYDALAGIYEALEQYDPGNLRAKQGVTAIESAKKQDGIIAEAESLMNKNEASDELALNKLRLVLLENSQHKKALPLYNTLLAKQAEVNKSKLTKKLTFNQPVTMEFRDVNLKMIFESLAKTTKINFILDKDVPSDQNATIFVKAVPFNDALDLLLQTNQLEKKVLSENSVIIYVNDVLHQRDYKDLSVRSFTLDYADAKQMSTILRTMLNMRSMEVDTRLNTLLIKDSPEILALAEKIIYAQDKADPEVMLEVQVMEITRSNKQDLGVNVPQGVSILPSGNVLTVKDLSNVTGSTLQVFQGKNGVGLSFNVANGNVNLLANPRIRVKNKETARIHIGEKVPVFTSNVASTGVSSQTVQYIDAGLKLEVEPQISATDDITIKVNLNVGSIGEEVVVGTGKAFRVGTRLTTTVLRLHDGETQILAGLIDDQDRKNVSGIPGLSKIPLLGKLFSSQTDDKIKTEIVLSITPHIIRQRTPQQAHEADIWTGPEGQTGRQSPSPAFANGVSPFMVPKPPPVAAPVAREEVPKNINLPLPPGFSLGGGLNSEQKATPSGKQAE